MQSTVRDIVTRSSRAAASFLFALLAIIGSHSAIAQVPGQGSFTLSGSLASGRAAHTATLLYDGHVLVVGGGQGPDLIDGFWVVPGAELFDPVTGSFAPAGISAHDIHTATLLQSGQVLIAGGESPPDSIPTATADLYDPAAKGFHQTGSMAFAREYHTATLLKDGRVLIAGGEWTNGIEWESLPFAEIYDPATGAFSVTGSLNEPRYGHTATLLTDGRVLITGGVSTTNLGRIASAEIYDPATGSFTYAGSMAVPRSFHTATLLLNGQVLISGGDNAAAVAAEVYNPATNSFQTVGSMTTPRSWHTATALADGTVLIAGGWSFPGATASAEIYDPASGMFNRTADMNSGRLMHTATLLSDGSVIAIGGASTPDDMHLNFINAAEVYKASNPRGQISASPNPCTLSGSLCTSYINWTTSGISNAQVWVRIGSGPEYLFAAALQCSNADCPAPWIEGNNSIYTFTMYDCSSVECSYISHSNAPVIASVLVGGTLRPAANQERCACQLLSRYSAASRLRAYPARSSSAAW